MDVCPATRCAHRLILKVAVISLTSLVVNTETAIKSRKDLDSTGRFWPDIDPVFYLQSCSTSPMNKFLSASSVALALSTFPGGTATLSPTPQLPVTNVYHGTTVVDNYLWLENFDDPAVKQWNAAENAFARAYLDKLLARAQVAARLNQLYSDTSANYSGLESRPGRLFAMKFKPPAQQPWLVGLKSAADPASGRVGPYPSQIT